MSSVQLTYPLFLSLLVFLPFLWRLLRHMPPAPRCVFFGGTMLLQQKAMRSEKKKHNFWLLLLRLLAVALMIVAASQPRLFPNDTVPSTTTTDTPPLLIMDLDWASGHNFAAMQEQAVTWLNGHGAPVLLMSSAPVKLGSLLPPQLMSVRAARRWVQQQVPSPWFNDYGEAQSLLSSVRASRVIWVTHDMAQPDKKEFADFLANKGDLTIALTPLPNLAVVRQPHDGAAVTTIADVKSRDDASRSLSFANHKGRNQTTVKVSGSATIDMPPVTREPTAELIVSDQRHAAGRLLFARALPSWRLGIIASRQVSPLLEESHYITQAAAGFSSPLTGTVQFLQQQSRVIIRTDNVTLTPEQEESLTRWVADGGHLIRFAGSRLYHLADHQPRGSFALTPLQQGELSEQTALPLLPFTETSPLFDVSIPSDLTLTPHLLLRQQPDSPIETWAQLEGGIPWIVSRPHHKGRETLVLTTANTEWGDLVLSPLFPPLLERLTAVQTSFVADNAAASSGEWQALVTLNGYGERTPHDDSFFASFDTTDAPSAAHPPGLYRHRLNGITVAHNLGDHIDDLTPFADFPVSARFVHDGNITRAVIDLAPYLALVALVLWLMDLWLLRFLSYLSLVLIVLPSASWGQVSDDGWRAATHPTIGIISQTTVPSWLHQALKGISDTTSQRTTTAMATPHIVDLQSDTLPLYPMLYWRFADGMKPLDKNQAARLNGYMEQGGILLLDVSDWEGDVTTMTRHLVIPPLVPMPHDHALTRAFYLLERAPNFNSQDVWLSRQPHPLHDHVSPLIVLNHDYARMWLAYHVSRHSSSPFAAPPAASVDGAVRFGVNLILYGLTGQYKKDQVHLDTILKRLKNRAR